MSFRIAANGAVLASLTSVLINVPIVARIGGQPQLTKNLARALSIVIAFGLLGIILHKPLEIAFQSLLPSAARLLQTRMEMIGRFNHTIGGNW